MPKNMFKFSCGCCKSQTVWKPQTIFLLSFESKSVDFTIEFPPLCKYFICETNMRITYHRTTHDQVLLIVYFTNLQLHLKCWFLCAFCNSFAAQSAFISIYKYKNICTTYSHYDPLQQYFKRSYFYRKLN